MPRLREVPRAEVSDDRVLFFYDHLFGPGRDPAADHGTATGSPGDWWTVFAQSPEVFRHAVRGFILYRDAKVDPLLRELGQCRAGWARGSRFVFSQHCKQLRAMGVPDDVLRSAVRFSFGPVLANADIDDAAGRVGAVVRRMREAGRMG